MKRSASDPDFHSLPAPAPAAASHPPGYRRAVSASALGWGLDGFDHTMFPLALGAILVSLGLSLEWGGTLSTVSLIASALGGMLGGLFADRYGRARVLMWVILGFSLFTALTATAQNAFQLLLWRSLEGLFFGAEWPVGVALLSEYATPERRGRLMAMMQSAYSIGWAGSTLAYFALFSLLPAELAWRCLFLLGLLPALAVFYIRRGVRDRVAPKREGRQGTLRADLQRLFLPEHRRTTLVATGFMIGTHGNYYAAVSFLPLYLSSVRGMPVAGTTSFLLVQILGGFIGYLASGFFHDRFGRRRTQTGAFILAIACMSAFVTLPVESVAAGLALIFGVGLTLSATAGGLGAILSEQFPTSIRGAGVGFSYNVGRGFAAFSPLLVAALAAKLGLGGAMLGVGASLACWGTLMLWLLPETQGKAIV